MIFITVGSQKFQFNRLLKAVDKLIEEKKITDEVFAQTGYCDYQPKHYKFKNFLDRDEFIEIENKADTVLTHGGTGVIINAVKKGKKVIAVPRLEKYGEHVDDHQLELLEEFENMKIILICPNIEELESTYRKIETTKLNTYTSSQENVLKGIDNFLDNM